MPERQRFGARPVVEIDGAPVRDDLAARICSVIVDTSLHQPDMVQVRLRDDGRDLLRRLGVRIGSTLAVTGARLGERGHAVLVRAEVTALEHDADGSGNFAVLRGYDVSHRLSRGRRTASYNDVTDADVVRQVARRAGLHLGRVDATATTHAHVAQVNATDWEFLTGRARETGFEVAVVQGFLEWRRPTAAAGGPLPGEAVDEAPAALQLTLGTNLLRLSARVTAGAQVTDVEVRGWDVQRKTAVVGRADAVTSSAQVALSPGALAGVFGASHHVCVDRPLASQPEADAVAAALAESLASVHAEADGVASGDPRLLAGTAVAIGLAGWPFDGRYTLTTARHVFDDEGYRTLFTVTGRQDRSLLGLSDRAAGPAVTGVVVAVVTAVEDPAAQGRVKLRFPWLAEDYESWWARVAQLGAGPQRGALWLPEVNDEVLVAFEHGDTRRPYVVGNLYNGQDTPPLGDVVDPASGQVRRRGFVSRQGHRLVFSDEAGSSGATVATGDGSLSIALDQTGTTITIGADGNVDIRGSRQVTVTSDGAISISAGTTLDLKAQAGVTVDGGPKVAVTGGLITLN